MGGRTWSIYEAQADALGEGAQFRKLRRVCETLLGNVRAEGGPDEVRRELAALFTPPQQAHHQRDRRGELVEEGFMTIREAIAFLRLGRSTLYGLMERGDLPYSCIGARRLIPRRALVDLAASRLRGDIPVPVASHGPVPGHGR